MAPQRSSLIDTSRRYVQTPRKYTRIRLSREARAAIKARQKAASRQYKLDVEDAWAQVDKFTEDLAVNHHKSLRRVQCELHMGRDIIRRKHKKSSLWNAFCWKKKSERENDENLSSAHGKEVLTAITRNYQSEYEALTESEKDSLLKEFEEYKASKSTGYRISAKSRINDITHTLKSIENELSNLRSRTGAESFLCITRGTTDLPMRRGFVFSTEGLDNFLESTMKIDSQDFVGRMEGFAVQGIKGAAQNHQQRVSAVRTEIRNMILDGLRSITGDEGARMQWKLYWRNVVQRYRVVIEGWPNHLPFKNLSDISTSFHELQNLLHMWRSGEIYWREIPTAEYNKMEAQRNTDIENGVVHPPANRRRRSDLGKPRSRSKKHKSLAEVDGEPESENQHVDTPHPTNADMSSN